MELTAQQKLLESAIEVFAQKGYRDTKIADIVKGAGANIAAVNYHFGSKDKIFLAALRQAFAEADAVYPSRGKGGREYSAKEKIATLARAVLLRSFDSGKAGHFNRIMCRTMHTPGSPVELILKEVEQLEISYLEAAIAEYLDTESKQLISWAIAHFIALATAVSKYQESMIEMVPASATREQIDCFIETQITSIFAAIDTLPKEFPE